MPLNVPKIRYADDLPVSQRREDIAAAIQEHPVVIVAGETGSGKTTQIPKICLEMGRGIEGMIGCTQPRRLAARTMSARVASELGVTPGSSVGYQVRFTDQTSDATLIKFMTDGILLAETRNDPLLERYDTLIIDEAHERSLNIDFLLGYIKRLLPKQPGLKVIVTSATIDTKRFAKHFNDAPIIEVTGRTYPVELRYQPPDEDSGESDIYSGIGEAVSQCLRHGPGDILVFLSGEREIRDAGEYLAKQRVGKLEILPLYARLSARDQLRVFKSGGQRRVILATNVAETSLTVPGIRFVIDPGFARISRYSHRSKVQRLPIESVSQASANQRKGRCGRIGPGLCIRLYGEEDFEERPEYTEPEIQRTALGAVILQMKALNLGDIESFPFIDPPAPAMISDGYRILQELGALDDRRRVTRTGRVMARIPADPRISRMLVQAGREGSLREVLIIAAALSIQDPRERPLDAQEKADAAHAEFEDKRSDFQTFLEMWYWLAEQERELSGNQFRKLCGKRFVSWRRAREWRDIHRQLREICKDLKLSLNRKPASYAALHRAILSGLLGHVGMKEEKKIYLGARNRHFQLFPGSGLFARPPDWVVSAALVETTRVYARNNAVIEPDWVEQVAAHLCKKSWSDPHWSKRANRVVAMEQVTLFGLPVVKGRHVDYSRVDGVEARRLFIRGALVHGEYRSDAAFMKHNGALVADVQEDEHRLRRQDVLADEDAVAAFFETHLPEEVINPRSFERWRKKAEVEEPGLLFLSRDILVREDAELPEEGQFPDHLQLAGTALPLSYHFDPASPEDGVTLHLPLPLLNAIEPGRLDWLVPGLLPDKITALLRSLPKSLRRSFVPVPDYTQALLQVLDPSDVPLTRAMAEELERMTGVKLKPEHWGAELPAHFWMNIRIEDKGKVVGSGRDLEDLRARFAGSARNRLRDALNADFHADGVKEWNMGDLPERIRVEIGGRHVDGFPALTPQQDAVGLRVFETEDLARRHHRAGLKRLLLLSLPRKVKYLRRSLPLSEQAVLFYAPIGSRDELVEDLMSAAIERIFQTRQLDARSLADFEMLRAEVERELVREVTASCEQLDVILEFFHRIRLRLDERDLEIHVNALDDIHSQLSHLIYPGFLRDLSAARLNHYPRYLEGVLLRLDRLWRAPDKDSERMDELATLWAEYEEHSGDPALDEFRWLLEEMRISLFAQELKTAVPVSVKRLRRALEQAYEHLA